MPELAADAFSKFYKKYIDKLDSIGASANSSSAL